MLINPVLLYKSKKKTSVSFGYLYNWFVVKTGLIAASGWHVPSRTEYETLITAAGGTSVAGGHLKLVSSEAWDDENVGADNSTGFSVVGSGYRGYLDGLFELRKSLSYMWTTTLRNPMVEEDAYCLTIGNYTAEASMSPPVVRNGMSIRLIKDTTLLADGQTSTYTGNDGKVYSTICIGGVEYLSENLSETKYNNGDSIPNITDNVAWTTLTTGAYCTYNNL